MVLKERKEPTQPDRMENELEAAEAEQQKKLKWAAIRERVRKH